MQVSMLFILKFSLYLQMLDQGGLKSINHDVPSAVDILDQWDPSTAILTEEVCIL